MRTCVYNPILCILVVQLPFFNKQILLYLPNEVVVVALTAR